MMLLASVVWHNGLTGKKSNFVPQKYENILEVNIGLDELTNRRIFRFGINLRDQLGRILVSEEGTG